MAGDRPEQETGDSLARARAVNRSCEAFEAAWRAGNPPAIAEYLDSAEPDGRDELFRELLALEIELRREAGQDPTVEEYVDRFPARDAAVRAVFCESASTEAERAAGRKMADATTRLPLGLRGESAVSTNAAIGEYELIEEIARGGMGVCTGPDTKG